MKPNLVGFDALLNEMHTARVVIDGLPEDQEFTIEALAMLNRQVAVT